MSPVPQRRHLALVDGILGGEGQGPLKPQAVHSGAILFSDNLLAADLACAAMMGFDAELIPMLREAQHLSSYPLLDQSPGGKEILLNGKALTLAELLGQASHHYATPLGWVGKI